MPVSVDPVPVPSERSDLARVHVATEDATGTSRDYDIILSQDTVDGAHVMAGSRVDDDAPDDPAGGGPSEAAYEAAAEHFQAEGYEVFGR